MSELMRDYQINKVERVQSLDLQANSFDVLRVVAALAVISTHLLAHLPPENRIIRDVMSYFNSYFYGVVTFFAISGFLIPKSIEKSTSFTSFMRKRILRLYPGVWCAFFVSFAVIMMLYKPQLSLQRIFIWFGTQLTLYTGVASQLWKWHAKWCFVDNCYRSPALCCNVAAL